ncbi:MAG: regulatory protein RecX [Chloroflexi bacterium]|nr:regulatory protein RecX [Chloroflexota bacterium]
MSPTVTAVEPRKSGVATVTIDGGDSLLLPLETVIMHRVRAGADFEDGDWNTLTGEGQRLLAVRTALTFLARRPRTERELRAALAKQIEDTEVVDHAVERMRALGYLDDAAWAKSYVGSGRARDRGRSLLKMELQQRGVPDTPARDAVEAHDEAAAALDAARKRARSLRDVEEPRRTRRLHDFLRRRGFPDNIAREAARSALAEAGETPADDADDL